MTTDWRERLAALDDDERIDTHTHSTCSDGTDSPSEIVCKAVEAGLAGVAISDHDTMAGYRMAAVNGVPKRFVLLPATELTAYYGEHEIHVLGYGFDAEDEALCSFLDTCSRYRRERAIKIIRNLREKAGIELEFEHMAAKHGKFPLGRPHIAYELVENGVCKNTYEAFHKYLHDGSPYMEQKYKVSVPEAVRVIHEAGGRAVLAHPGMLSKQVQVTVLLTLGLDGIETGHPRHHITYERAMNRYSRKREIPTTGGSDYHGAHRRDVEVGNRTTTAKQLRQLLSAG
ncbi:MAG: PHP domain-containing protein [Planctomycetota bacterium]|nr:PHP domain-containing protein [Planctomycetota bacterium]